MPKKLLPSILFTGLIAGVADIILAFISICMQNNVTPDRVLRFVASGLFGKEAFTGGTIMIVFGLLFHFIIATAFTAIFFFIYPKISRISSNKTGTGIFYGIVVWSVMNLIVLPLSNAPALPIKLVGMLTGMFILIVAIGLPIAYFANKYYSQKIIRNESF